jgi:PAS domain S-box-containing protein
MHRRFPPAAIWMMAMPLFGADPWSGAAGAAAANRGELEERVMERTAELARSEERYRVVSELGSDLGFGFRIDLDDQMYDGWVTEAYSRITGYALDELKGTGWHQLIHPEDQEQLRRQFAAIRQPGARARGAPRHRRGAVTAHARLDVKRVEGLRRTA